MTISDWISIGTTTATVAVILYFALCVRSYRISVDRLVEVMTSEDDDDPDGGERTNVIDFKRSA